ncbi:MAG TPA: hypothetical protein ENH91_03705 [Leeuwenhoekiella sp.]|nr:hypothetical protein [Leeuwenhoekiella sp.]
MNRTLQLFLIVAISTICFSCGDKQQKSETETAMKDQDFKKGTFGYDLNFLKQRDTSLVVLGQGESEILVSPRYQAKVFTSTAEGMKGKSFGWINYNVFDQELDSHMNAYGGENRFWLGPEGSKFSLFFKPGTAMEYENWHTPSAVDTETWQVTTKDDKMVRMEKTMSLQNYADTQFEILAKRSIKILDKSEIENLLNISLDSVSSVGFTTENSIANMGDHAWDEKSGAPCIWILDMFTPSPKTVIVVPYNEEATGKVATTDYFGEIPKDRISYKDGKIFLMADGKSRGKLGVPPQRAKNMTGSYDPVNHVLTITRFEVDEDATYLNQEWMPDKNPLVGDAVNAYNDGPLEDGSQMGPFYEIESVSPAAFIAPSETLSHQHSVFHFTGEEQQLNGLSIQLLGTPIEEIKNAF